jgi:hypothetical protein
MKKINATARHPTTNGSLERSHRVLIEFIRHFADTDQRNWDYCVRYAVFAMQCNRQCAVPVDKCSGGLRTYSPIHRGHRWELVTEELKRGLQTSYAVAKARSKDYYDNQMHESKCEVGDLVLLQYDSPRRNRCKKLGPSWIGPYAIKEINGVNVTLQLRRFEQTIVHMNRIKPFFV